MDRPYLDRYYSMNQVDRTMEEQITVTLPSGVKKSLPKGARLQDFCDDDAIAVQMDGMMVDLSRSPEKDASITCIPVHSRKGLDVLRHSAAHVMAQAVKELFPSAKLTFGPATESGFYYDFEYERPFTPQDLEKIEERMAQIIEQNLPFVRQEVLKGEAIKTFQKEGESYKVEHLQELPDRVSLYPGTFNDLCEDPMPLLLGRLNLKLLNVSGTYWRGCPNQVLQGFMALHSRIRRPWMNTFTCLKRPQTRPPEIREGA
jgi:threonyl-tRNA synthetase